LSLVKWDIWRFIKSNEVSKTGKMNMSTKTQRDIEKTRLLKAKDSDINLTILFDQTSTILTNAIDLELRHFKTNQTQIRVLTMLSRENRPITIDELANWCLKEFIWFSLLFIAWEKRD